MEVASTSFEKFNYLIKGFSYVFTLSGKGFLEDPDPITGFEQDREALAGDWQLIGNDMRIAINKVVSER